MRATLAAASSLSLMLVLCSPAAAQPWSLEAGGAGRLEWRDNYFFTSTDPVQATTASVVPFLTVALHAPTRDLAAQFTVGGNHVWGSGADDSFVDFALALDGSWRTATSTVTADMRAGRSRSLQSVQTPEGIVFALARTDSANAQLGASHPVSERWTISGSASAYGNRYEAIAGGSGLEDNRGLALRGKTSYEQSEQTQASLALAVARFQSDVERNDATSLTVEVRHAYAPGFTVTGTVGGFVSWADPRCTAPGCVAGGKTRHGGALYGAGVEYAVAPRTRLEARIASDLAPSASGTLLRTDNVGFALAHDLSERVVLGAGVRALRERALDHSTHSDYYAGDLKVTWLIAERWSLDAGYTYSRGRYGGDLGSPHGNVVFLGIAYNGTAPLVTSLGAWQTGALGSGTPGLSSTGTPAAAGDFAPWPGLTAPGAPLVPGTSVAPGSTGTPATPAVPAPPTP